MTMYNIEITYKTGNSFGSHTEVDLIGACWNDSLELWKIPENAEVIKGRMRKSKNKKDIA